MTLMSSVGPIHHSTEVLVFVPQVFWITGKRSGPGCRGMLMKRGARTGAGQVGSEIRLGSLYGHSDRGEETEERVFFKTPNILIYVADS